MVNAVAVQPRVQSVQKVSTYYILLPTLYSMNSILFKALIFINY